MHFFQSTLRWSSASCLHSIKVVLYKNKTVFCLITRNCLVNKVEIEYTTNRSNLTYLDSLLYDFLQSSYSNSFHVIFKSFFLLYFEDTYIYLFNFCSLQNFSTQPVCAQLKTKQNGGLKLPRFRPSLFFVLTSL